MKLQSRFNLRKEIRFLNIHEALDVIKRCEEGIPDEVILRVAKEVGASFIIAGMKGISKIELDLFGSTALGLSRTSTIPLMLIPEDACFTTPKAIALASDINNNNDVHILDPLKDLGEQFNSKMYIVRVVKENMDELEEKLSKPTRLKWHLRSLNPDYEFVNDNDVTHALNKFIDDHEIDMIAMTTKEHSLFERLFVKSNIKAMMVQTQVPLVILPGSRKIKDSATPEMRARVA